MSHCVTRTVKKAEGRKEKRRCVRSQQGRRREMILNRHSFIENKRQTILAAKKQSNMQRYCNQNTFIGATNPWVFVHNQNQLHLHVKELKFALNVFYFRPNHERLQLIFFNCTLNYSGTTMMDLSNLDMDIFTYYTIGNFTLTRCLVAELYIPLTFSRWLIKAG